jgi:hypothetical protein
MRKVKVVNVEGRGEVTVKEVSPYAVYQAWGETDRMAALQQLLDDALSPSFAQVKTWYSSEIEQVVAAFMEVNDSFFGIARQLKADGLLAELVETISKNLPSAFASSFNQAMQTPGAMGGQRF